MNDNEIEKICPNKIEQQILDKINHVTFNSFHVRFSNKFLIDNYCFLFIYKIKKEIISVAFLDKTDDYYLIQTVCTLEQYRNNNYATKLIKEIINYCKTKHERDKIVLRSTPKAINFYKKIGFKLIDKNIMEFYL